MDGLSSFGMNCVGRFVVVMAEWSLMAELPDRMKLEAKIGVVLSRLGSRQRKELEQLLGNPPNIDNVTESWWTDKQAELAAVLLLLLSTVYYKSARLHGLDVEAAREASQKWASKQSTDLASDFTKNSRDILKTDARDWTGEELTKKAIRETTLKMLGPKRMANVAVTETTRAQTEGGETAIDETVGLSPKDVWVTERDAKVCKYCKPFSGTVRRYWERYYPDGPPLHVNCRCYLSYALVASEK